jgi:hypothetical protein
LIPAGIGGKEAIARSLDQSLQNLGMDYIDLYIYHIWDHVLAFCHLPQRPANVSLAGAVLIGDGGIVKIDSIPGSVKVTYWSPASVWDVWGLATR